jgi:hypothetical protein
VESSPSPGGPSADQGCAALVMDVSAASGPAPLALTAVPIASDRTIHAAARASRTRLGRELLVGIGCVAISGIQMQSVCQTTLPVRVRTAS